MDYWLVFATDSATLTVHRNALTGTIVSDENVVLSKATSFPLPATISGPATGTITPWLRVN